MLRALRFSKYLNIAEQIKRVLSTETETTETVDGPKGSQDIEISRKEFEEKIEYFIDTIKMLIEGVLDDCNLDPSEISQTLLVGGSTRVPCIIELIKETMLKPPTKGVDVDQAVAAGAAIFAGKNSPEKDLTINQKKNLNINYKKRKSIFR